MRNLIPGAGNYFDNAATTPLDPRVLEAMLPFMTESFGNANSLHHWGTRALDAVETARGQVAKLLGIDDPEEIVFTSGATEANNWLLGGSTVQLSDFTTLSQILISPFEHASIWELRDKKTVLDWNGERLSGPRSDLSSVMLINNETGQQFDPSSVDSELKHSDITQALGKIEFDLDGLNFASMSAHKLYGPKGVGALWAKDRRFPQSVMNGGGQEQGHRAGTLNVPGIVGFGAACRIAPEEKQESFELATELRAILIDHVKRIPGSSINGKDCSPYILNLSFEDVQGESLVIELDNAGFGISAGAACSSGSTKRSHVLSAMGLDENAIRGSIRISFGKFNTKEAANSLGKVLAGRVESLRNLK